MCFTQRHQTLSDALFSILTKQFSVNMYVSWLNRSPSVSFIQLFFVQTSKIKYSIVQGSWAVVILLVVFQVLLCLFAVLSAIYCLLGVLAEMYPEHVTKYSPRFYNIIVPALKVQVFSDIVNNETFFVLYCNAFVMDVKNLLKNIVCIHRSI